MSKQVIAQTLPEDSTVLIPTRSREVIQSISPPISPAADRQIRTLIEQESLAAKMQNLAEWFKHLQKAKAEAEIARIPLEENRRALAAAERDREQWSPVSWVKVVVFLVGTSACLADEFSLTWVTLPFLLNVRRTTFLGVMLALAPAMALLILDWVIYQLGLTEKPLKVLRSMADNLAKRIIAVACLVVFLAAVAGVNVSTVVLMAQAREEAAKVKQNLEQMNDSRIILVDMEKIDHAIVWVSVMVMLDGALFFLLGMEDLQNLSRQIKGRVSIWQYRRKQRGLEAGYLMADAEFTHRRKNWEESEERAAVLAESFKAQRLFELEYALSRSLPSPSAVQVVERQLRKRLASGLSQSRTQ